MKSELLLFVLAVVIIAANPRPAAAQRGTVTGVVVKSPSGEPAAGAAVKLTDEPPSVGPPGHQTQSTTTAADGSFRFDNVERPSSVVTARSNSDSLLAVTRSSPLSTI